MGDVGDNLLAVLKSLEDAIRRREDGGAIDRILAEAPRGTRVRSLRDHEVVRQFRRELADGLIRVDTANRFLGVIRMAVEAALA